MAPQPVAKKVAPKNRVAKISAARKEAFNILLALERGHSHSDDLLRGRGVNALAALDKNLATALVLGVLRWQIWLDAQIRAQLARPKARLDAEILTALRMGAFQILRTDRIPARAAIDESVELAKRAGHRFASAMVNAVLRKMATTHGAEVRTEGAEELAAIEAHPAWMVERWARFFGDEAASAICRHGQMQPGHALRLADETAKGELSEAGITFEPGQLLTAAGTVVIGDAASSAAFAQGRVRMQDEGSQLVAEVCAASLEAEDGRILDACAAPGGKTMILAERKAGASIVAGEFSQPRLEQLRHRLIAYAGRVECRLWDATEVGEEAAFDLVLADVPCSGTGTLGRNPEIRHRLRMDDLARQAERQRSILAAALRAVKPGGRVIYSTCSLEPEENEEVIAAVLGETPGVGMVSLEPSIDGMAATGVLSPLGVQRLKSCLLQNLAMRLMPGTFKTDGFFIAALKRGK
jgi:16S rRNA (cytosine967-C5)-methyltransferase